METLTFVWSLDDDRIVAAIRAAEDRTSGEIRVYVSDADPVDPVAAAQLRFIEMGMIATADRNGVLIFVAPRSQRFAIIGDTSVHARCGEKFWQEVTAEMARHFAREAPTDAIVRGIEMAGELLSAQFPIRHDDRNELPDKVERGA
jgi:uncharacterized membrane protein